MDAGEYVLIDDGRDGPRKLGGGPGGASEGVDRLTSALSPKGGGTLAMGEHTCLKWL